MAPNSSNYHIASGRIPSLDGLRAISILLVIALHSLQRYSVNHHVPLVFYDLCNGSLGVQIFFVISGFLITALLLQERRKFGSISLSGFYIRRAFRILPPLYTYIAVVALIGISGRIILNRNDIISAVLFFHNYSRSSSMWSLEHLWSICIEEQFYLVWPFILCACLAGDGVEHRLRAAVFPVAVLAISPPLRTILGLQHSHPILRDIGLKINYDFIMFGCLIALLQGVPRFETIYRIVTRIWWIWPIAIFLLGAISMRFEHYFDLPIGYTITGAAIAIFILWCTRNPDRAVGRALNFRPIVQIGVLSYSIYLWQTLFLHHLNYQVFGRYSWIGSFPSNWIAILIVAAFSYYVIEKPSLRLRLRLIESFHLDRSSRLRPAPR